MIQNIERICYEVYKIDDVRENVTRRQQVKSVLDYYDAVSTGLYDGSYEEYIYENGFANESVLLSSFEDFLEYEFLDQEYMRRLLMYHDNRFIDAYQKRLAEIQQQNNDKTNREDDADYDLF